MHAVRPAILILLVATSCSSNGDQGEVPVDSQPILADLGDDPRGDGATLDAGQAENRCQPGPELLALVSPARMLADMEYLVGLQERRSHEGQQKAADYISSELAKLPGFQLREQSYSYAGQSWVNLEATRQGSSDPATFVIAGAHLDSSSYDPQLAPGADDNASGTVAVLEAARVLATCVPERSIRLLFFSNEEPGMVGSEAYVQSIKGSLPKERLIGFINVDMVAYGPQDEDLDVATRPEHATFAQQVGQTVEQHTTLKVKSIVSDHCG